VTLSAEELYRRGVEHGNAGRTASARRVLGTALARTQDPDLRARIQGTLAYLASRTGDPLGAERTCRDALATGGLSPGTAAILEGQLGALAVHRGDLTEAVEWLTRAIARIGDDPQHRASMLMNRSVAHMQAGRLEAARSDLDAAIADFDRTGRPADSAMAAHNVGYVLLLEGDLVASLAHMAEARRAMGGISTVNVAIGDLDRAEVLRDAGQATEAERLLAEVAHTFGAHGMRQARGEAELHLARSLLTHDPERSAIVAATAARRFRALGSTTWAARALGVRLRAQLSDGPGGGGSRRTRHPRADTVEATASELEHLGLTSDAAALRLTHARWSAHRGRVSTKRLPTDRVGGSIQVRLLAAEARAARAAAAGRDPDARRYAAQGLDQLLAWQRTFGSLDLQTSTRMHGSGLLAEGVAAAVRSGRPDVVFDWSERSRHLAQAVVPLRPPPDPDLASDLAELRLLRAADASGDWLASPQAARLRERVRERQWSSTGVAGLDAQVSLEELREALGADTAFVTWVLTGDEMVCLVTSSATTRLVRVGAWPDVRRTLAGLRADLEVTASVRSGPMAAVTARALGSRLAELSALLADAPMRGLHAGRLVVTAPGVLAGLPWPMLPAFRERWFTLATSATRWVHEHGREAPASAGFAVGPRVARGDEEVDRASSAWPASDVLRDGAATVDAVTDVAARVGVLHVAAHGRHAADNPLFSGLELADGTLFGYDIDRMPCVPHTTVLSACEVGRSSVRWGEEAIGMTRAWLHAGAACVIAAPVVVADDEACELLGAMHVGLAAGRTPAEALVTATATTGIVAPFQCHGSGF
jgi:tetratricopeptide (TPR) repeat protein